MNNTETNNRPDATTGLAAVIKINRRSAFSAGRSKEPKPASAPTGLASAIRVRRKGVFSTFPSKQSKPAEHQLDHQAVERRFDRGAGDEAGQRFF